MCLVLRNLLKGGAPGLDELVIFYKVTVQDTNQCHTQRSHHHQMNLETNSALYSVGPAGV